MNWKSPDPRSRAAWPSDEDRMNKVFSIRDSDTHADKSVSLTPGGLTLIRNSRFISIAKIVLLVGGLWLLFRPEPANTSPADHRGQVLVRAIGGVLIVIVVFPYRSPPPNQDAEAK